MSIGGFYSPTINGGVRESTYGTAFCSIGISVLRGTSDIRGGSDAPVEVFAFDVLDGDTE